MVTEVPGRFLDGVGALLHSNNGGGTFKPYAITAFCSYQFAFNLQRWRRRSAHLLWRRRRRRRIDGSGTSVLSCSLHCSSSGFLLPAAAAIVRVRFTSMYFMSDYREGLFKVFCDSLKYSYIISLSHKTAGPKLEGAAGATSVKSLTFACLLS